MWDEEGDGLAWVQILLWDISYMLIKLFFKKRRNKPVNHRLLALGPWAGVFNGSVPRFSHLLNEALSVAHS